MEYRPTVYDRLMMVMENCKTKALATGELQRYSSRDKNTGYQFEVIAFSNGDLQIGIGNFMFDYQTNVTIAYPQIDNASLGDDEGWIMVQSQKDIRSYVSIPVSLLNKLV